MNKRAIGVWFSVVLLIFIISIWLGYESGTSIARHRATGPLSAVEDAHFNHVLSALSDMNMMRFGGFHDSEKLKSNLLSEIGRLETLRSRPDIQDVKPVAD